MLLSVRPGMFFILLILCGFISCNKESTESQGTNFNLLLKTVTKSNFSSTESTVNFTYNNSSQVTATKTTYLNTPTGTEQQAETFYRNITGRLDSIAYTSSGSLTVLTLRTFLTYDGTGKLAKSIQISNGASQIKDSSLYIYSGNVLQERFDYRSFSGGAFSLLRRGSYTFDGSGNLTQAIFQWPVSNVTETARFEYDTKINPLPLDRLIFAWAPVFYNDYKPLNNPTLLLTEAAESFNNEYTYTPNNKPLYRKSRVVGNTSSFYETWYYYD